MNEAPSGGLIAFQSDRVEDLVDRLVLALVRDERRRASSPAERPFIEHKVVIPTRNLTTYLQFEISARLGIASNIEFLTLERFLESLLPLREDGEPAVRLLTHEAITRQVLALLDEPSLIDRPEVRAVRRFIEADGETEAMMMERRKFQLAARLANLFEEYGFSRQKMLKYWRSEDSALQAEYKDRATAAHLEIEGWQMALWRQLFGPKAELEGLDGDDRPWMTLAQALVHYVDPSTDELQWPETVHFFGHSYLPRFFRDFFSTRTYDRDHRIVLYVMNPCLEYWGNGVAGDRDEDPVFELLAEESPLEGDEYPLPLAIWGRAGRDYQRMIEAIAYDRENISQSRGKPAHTLLQHFQAMIRDMKTARQVFEEVEPPTDEKSLNFWSCASAQRECEAIASEIYELVSTHEDLRFNDIAVVVQPGDRAVYQTHLESAFAQTGAIPCNIIDVEASQTNPFLEASRLLLELPLGNFRRRELLALLIHPNLVANHPSADVESWIKWCDALNIFQGGDRKDLASTYLNEDRFTWGQGMRRLVLGAFMSQPALDRPLPFEIDGDRYLPHETDHQDADTVAILTMLVDELIHNARISRSTRRPLNEWIQVFREQVTNHLEPRDRQQQRTRMAFFQSLERIAESDICPDEEVGYRTAFDFATVAMGELEDTRGQYLADGVVVSAFRPMRPIPFEVVFVTGLGEGRFPAPDPPDMLDLRRVRSEEHDVNPRYQDQYMFLETLISTRSRLYLSWVGRHAITGDPLEPAPVVHQLREMILEMGPGDGEDAEAVRESLKRRVAFVEHPLRRYDDRYFPQFSEDEATVDVIDARGPDAISPRPVKERNSGDTRSEKLWPNHHREAQREAYVRSVRRRLQAQLPTGYEPTMQELRQALEDSVFARLADLVDWDAPRQASPGVDSRRFDGHKVVLQFSHLRNFLRCPLQGSARVLLHIYDEDDRDVLDVDHEPFEANFLTRLGLIRRAFEDALRRGDLSDETLHEVFDDQAHAAELSGELPAGIFFDAERKKCVDILKSYAGALGAEKFSGTLRRVRFGAANERESVDENRAPIGLDIVINDEPVRVELHGTASVIDDGKWRSVVPAAGKNAGAKYFLPAGVEQLALQASGVTTEGRVTVVTTTGEAKDQIVSAANQQGARAYLQTVVTDLLEGLHDYFLPIELVEKVMTNKLDPHDEEALLREANKLKEPSRHDGKPGASSKYGPVRRWADARPPSGQEVTELVRRRYAPFVDELGD